MEVKFAGQKALVTGAGKGIGRAVTIALATCGAHVFAVSRTQADLDELVSEERVGERITPICLDIQNTADMQAKIGALPTDITLLVNNAAVAVLENFLDVTEKAYDDTMNINVKPIIFLSQIIARNIIAHGSAGAIVNVSSQASQTALPGHTTYCASKGAVDQLTRMMALELGPSNIRVNAVNPTVVLTKMGKLAWEGPTGEPMRRQIPLMNKFAEVEDVVNAVLYLLSDGSSMISGVTLPIDGGFLATRTMK